MNKIINEVIDTLEKLLEEINTEGSFLNEHGCTFVSKDLEEILKKLLTIRGDNYE